VASEEGKMLAAYVSGMKLEGVLDPDGPAWKAARPERVTMMGTPIGLQPTDAIRVAWAQKKIGQVERVNVAAVHDGQTLAIRLEWGDASENRTLEDTTAFPDGAGVLFPSAPGAPAVTMGAPGLPVNAWHWRADEEGGRQVVAEGLGTTRTVNDEQVRARGVWKAGRWRVVIARALKVEASEPVVQLEAGGKAQFAVAVWEGSSGERAGIKAFSVDWRDLSLATAPMARR
jgi:DMSO reductase family type II enzyme heme b subunit